MTRTSDHWRPLFECGLNIERNAGGAVLSDLASMHSVERLQCRFAFDQTSIVCPSKRAPRSVPTKRTTSIRISKVHLEPIFLWLHHHDPVRADALFAVTQGANFRVRPIGRQASGLTSVDEHKIIACAFPFLELHRHETKVGPSSAEMGRHGPIFGTCPNLRNLPHPQGCSRFTKQPAPLGLCQTSSKSTLGSPPSTSTHVRAGMKSFKLPQANFCSLRITSAVTIATTACCSPWV